MSEDANNDPIGKALNLNPIETTSVVKNIISDAHNDSAKTDFDTARSNILTVIDDGQEAIHKMLQIATSSQHPRAFEVLGKLFETVLQANKDLMDLQVKIRDIQAKDAPISEQAKTINQSIFVGSTAELSDLINNMKRNNIEKY